MWAKATGVQAPMAARAMSQITKVVPRGKGGRSSVSAISATVFGSTGFLGRYVVGRIAKIGSQVVCPYRNCELDYRHLRPMGDLGQIHFNEYGILNPNSINDQLLYSNVAVNLVGQEYLSRHFSMEDVNVDGARNIARAAKEYGMEKFIHVSALGADVDSPSEYLRTKALGEEAVKEEFPEAVIIRCSNMFGMEDRWLNRIAVMAGQMPGPFPLVNMGEVKKSPVHVVDVAAGIVEAIWDPEADGKTFEFVGPKEYTMQQIVDYIGETTRVPIWSQGLPEEVSGLIQFGYKLGGLARLESLPNEEEFFRYALDDKKSYRAPGLEELGIKKTTMESIGINVLRKYRPHVYHDDIVDSA